MKVSLEPKHDFTAKLQQREFLPAVRRYVEWRQAISRARAGSQPEPPAPTDWVPLSINLDLTTACNYECTHCIDFEILNTGKMHKYLELLESLGRMIRRGLRSVILIGGGEPTLHPKFEDVVRFLKERNVQVAVVSNGSRNEAIYSAAGAFSAGDWVRFSLDSGLNDTFIRMHKPRRQITLEEICSWVPRIRERNPALSVGFSFIITWEGAARDGDVPIIPNIGEIVAATELALRHKFTYIAFKPILTRHPSGSEVMDPEVIRNFENTLELIRVSVAKAKTYQSTDFKVIESTNLRVLLADTWRDFTKQPHTCHMQAFRQVLSPLGLFNCPAYRGVDKARIAGADAFTAAKAGETSQLLTGMLDTFDPSCECKKITCLYQPTNWWLEGLINGEGQLTESPGADYYL